MHTHMHTSTPAHTHTHKHTLGDMALLYYNNTKQIVKLKVMAPSDWGCAQVLWALSIKYSSGHSEYKAALYTRSVLAPESGYAVQYDQSGYAVQI